MLIFAAILAIFVYGLIAAMLGTILPDLSKRFQLTPKQNGNIALAQAIGLIVASVSVGPLMDNAGLKPGLVLGLALVMLALYALPQSKGYGSVLVLLLVLGLGGGIIVTGANSLVSDISEARRAATLNFLNLFFGLGGLATPFISANLLSRNSVKLCYLVAGLTTVTLVVHLIAPIPPPTGERSFQFAQAGDLLSQPVLWLLALLLFLYVAAEVGVWNWLPRHLIAQGIPEGRALNILSLGFALGLLIGRMAVAPILITVPASTVTLVGALLIAVTTWLALQTSSPKVAWIAVFCAGLAMAPVFPTTLAMVGNAFKVATSTAMGLVITAGWVGLAVSSSIIGGIAGEDPKRLKKALLILPLFAVLMVLVNLIVRVYL
ncbi:MAG: MFS transporter [Bryobacterales bacterium]|nr:MFS transporter [Bryobacterales bacterium]